MSLGHRCHRLRSRWLERDIASTDREIDELVYVLYGITDEEQKIIEGG
jgi:hypothetical protein